MNLLFQIKNTYLVQQSAEAVRTDIEDMLGGKWYDFSRNITGNINAQNEFMLKPKWELGFVQVLGFLQSITYLTGTISEQDGAAMIKTIARPNYLLVVLFYVCLSLIILKLCGVNISIEGSLVEVLITVFTFCVVFAAIMIVGTLRLRNRFVRIMKLYS